MTDWISLPGIIDREAQRAIRQRTKDQIGMLEKQIQELTSKQPYQELVFLQRAKEAVEQENAEIKRRLALVIGELQPLVGPGECYYMLAVLLRGACSLTNSSKILLSPALHHRRAIALLHCLLHL